MSESVRNWTSTQVKALLQSRFGGGSQCAVLFEVRNSTGHDANRSIDAVTMSLWPSLGLELSGMEIKVSRSDWLRELKEPAKASATFEYFDRWYLVAPRHVAKMDEIPGPWGWMAPEDDKLVTLKKAPLNADVKPVDRKFLAAMLRCQTKGDDGLIQAAVSRAAEVERKRLTDQHKQNVEAEVQRRISAVTADAKSWRDLVGKLGEHRTYLDSEALLHAVGVVQRLGLKSTYGSLARLAETLDRSSKQVATALADLNGPLLAAPSQSEDAA